jgi:hypothetical protein
MRRLPALTALVMLAALVASCGGGAGSSTTSTTANSSLTAFTSCMKQHGVTPRAGFGGGQPPSGSPPSNGNQPQRPAVSAKVQKALVACRSLRPQGGGGGFGGPPSGFSGNS